MTIAEATSLALSVHGAVCLVAAAAYYKFGDRKVLFDKLPQDCRRLMRSIKDEITTDLWAQLRPIVRDSIRAQTTTIKTKGDEYIEEPADVTEGEIYYQAIRDFVTNSSGSLVDYSVILKTVKAWRVWAHLLSWLILILVILEVALLAMTLLVLVSINGTEIAPLWSLLLGSVPTVVLIVGVFTCLILVHVKQGTIVDMKINYDTN